MMKLRSASTPRCEEVETAPVRDGKGPRTWRIRILKLETRIPGTQEETLIWPMWSSSRYPNSNSALAGSGNTRFGQQTQPASNVHMADNTSALRCAAVTSAI